MTYVIQAVLSDPRRPACGQCTIPFPIPDDAYDDMIEMLGGIGIGDAVAKDCRIDAVDSFYGVLGSLTGTMVNVDELDYLAKRLDSFCDNEAEQFQAMAHKLELKDIKDFINLTFCCQRATVISDFSKLEQVGKAHRMNLNDGTISTEEWETMDGRKEALQLIQTGAGTVTPYGVVYDNGMKLEQLYYGRHFPSYLYDVPMLVLMFVMFGIIIFADAYYISVIFAAISRPDNPIVVTTSTSYIAYAEWYLEIHITILCIAMVLIALLPVYSKMLRRVKTSIEVGDNGSMGAIDISGEE